MPQSTDTLLLIRPSHFGFNHETAPTNSFQNNQTDVSVKSKALDEFNEVVARLEKAAVKTIVFNDKPQLVTPDSIFPNNWITFHNNGLVVIYPMQAINRRIEKRPELVDSLKEEFGFDVQHVVDLSEFEKNSQFLEGTGSMVFDHLNKTVYVSASSRSHTAPLTKLADLIQYRVHLFSSVGHLHQPIYHTNVMLSLGTSFAMICSSAVNDISSRQALLLELEKSNRQIIEITGSQMQNFAANILEIKSSKGDPLVLISTTALKSLQPAQTKALEKYASLLPVSVPTIEKIGGGGIRCMVAEIFLPQNKRGFQVAIAEPQSAADFEAYFGLRWNVLRKPWNQPPGSEKDELEESTIHRMAVTRESKLAGVARLQFNDHQQAQVRFMAVADEYQGKGVGKKLMFALEEIASKAGRKSVMLQARENAVPFYQSIGYTIVERTFLLYGEIQHFRMEKTLL